MKIRLTKVSTGETTCTTPLLSRWEALGSIAAIKSFLLNAKADALASGDALVAAACDHAGAIDSYAFVCTMLKYTQEIEKEKQEKGTFAEWLDASRRTERLTRLKTTIEHLRGEEVGGITRCKD